MVFKRSIKLRNSTNQGKKKKITNIKSERAYLYRFYIN